MSCLLKSLCVIRKIAINSSSYKSVLPNYLSLNQQSSTIEAGSMFYVTLEIVQQIIQKKFSLTILLLEVLFVILNLPKCVYQSRFLLFLFTFCCNFSRKSSSPNNLIPASYGSIIAKYFTEYFVKYIKFCLRRFN